MVCLLLVACIAELDGGGGGGGAKDDGHDMKTWFQENLRCKTPSKETSDFFSVGR